MAGLVPAIHASLTVIKERKTWMPATSAGMTAGRCRALISTRHCQLEAHQAFELAFGLPARVRVDLGLALLAQIAGGELGERAALDGFLAALLDEGAEHRCLA